MPTTADANRIELPAPLIAAVQDRRAVVFLGAGASKECRDAKGNTPPNADQLATILAKKFFGEEMPGMDVMTVAEMAISSSAGAGLVFDEVRHVFEKWSPSSAHLALSKFVWRQMATTNYDTYVEQAYDKSKNRVQNLVPFVKNDEPIEDRLHKTPDPLVYLKLHGSLDFRHDIDFPLILSKESYEFHQKGRERLFDRLKSVAYESTIIFIGYRLDDPHIRSLIYRIEQKSRPRWYIVTPEFPKPLSDFWATRNVEAIKARFGEFMEALERQLSPSALFTSRLFDFSAFPIARHFTSTKLSENLQFALTNDLTHIHAGLPTEAISAKRYYEGYDVGWYGIQNSFDVRRSVVNRILSEYVIENENATDPTFVLLQGPAGAGKTVALKRAAFEASQLGVLALWLEDRGALRTDTISELWELAKKPIFLFVDGMSAHVSDVQSSLRFAKARKIPLIVIGAEREADWMTYCSILEDEFQPLHLFIRNLSLDEIEQLVDLLTRHDCLGELKVLTREQQVAAFLDADRADRQLLVALHELTQGKPFEEIIGDEFKKIRPAAAQQIYLDIATMHQFGARARAGAISRISGVEFAEFQQEFLGPLVDTIQIKTDPYTKDYLYATRHPKIASMVFHQACEDDRAKSEQYNRVVAGLDVGYSSDLRTLEEITKGRAVANGFSNVDDGRLIYRKATESYPDLPFLWQQFAIFETNHRSGSHEDAKRYAEIAREKDPKNRTIIHTQAEIERMLANDVDSTFLKDSYRARARKFLSEMPSGDKFVASSRCKLLVDEVFDMSRALSSQSSGAEFKAFSDKVHDAETAVTRAQQDFPGEAELFQIEARLRGHLGNDAKALNALERAWNAGTRTSGTGIKIAEIYESQDRKDDALKILKDALHKFPDDKQVHGVLAMFNARNRSDNRTIENHLKKSFSPNDNNFEARFNAAQFYFMIGKFDEAKMLFEYIDSKSPITFRTHISTEDTVFSSALPDFHGVVATKSHSYLFVRTPSCPDNIYCHIRNVGFAEFSQLAVGDRVTFRIRFDRKGPQGWKIGPA